jgi:hypothetical protein
LQASVHDNKLILTVHDTDVGRFYYRMNRIPKELRSVLLHDYVEIDLNNAAYRIIINKAKEKNLNLPAFEYYIKNRNDIIQAYAKEIAQVMNVSTRSDKFQEIKIELKKLFLSILFGKNINFINPDCSFLERTVQKHVQNKQFIQDMSLNYKALKNIFKKPSDIFMLGETQIMQDLKEIVQQYMNSEMDIFQVHDAIFICTHYIHTLGDMDMASPFVPGLDIMFNKDRAYRFLSTYTVHEALNNAIHDYLIEHNLSSNSKPTQFFEVPKDFKDLKIKYSTACTEINAVLDSCKHGIEDSKVSGSCKHGIEDSKVSSSCKHGIDNIDLGVSTYIEDSKVSGSCKHGIEDIDSTYSTCIEDSKVSGSCKHGIEDSKVSSSCKHGIDNIDLGVSTYIEDSKVLDSCKHGTEDSKVSSSCIEKHDIQGIPRCQEYKIRCILGSSSHDFELEKVHIEHNLFQMSGTAGGT